MKYSKLIVATSSLLLLNGCLDKSDDKKVANAIKEQTQAISAQQNNVAKVSFTGLIVDSFDKKPLTSAIATVNVGDKAVVSDLAIVNGKLKVDDLPANSDIEVIIASKDNEYLTRAFFLNTGDGNSNAAVKDFGLFKVSKPKELKISLLETGSNNAIDKLTFVAYSHTGSGSTIENYKHVSRYDAVNKEYSITIPQDIDVNVQAQLDLNRDGKRDFTPEDANYLAGSHLLIRAANTRDPLTIYLESDVVASDITFRVSIVDSQARAIEGASLSINDRLNNLVQSTYDADTEQYVLNAKLSERIELQLPAFTANNIDYRSASVSIDHENGDLRVAINGSRNGNCCYTIPFSNEVALVVQPQVNINNDEVEVVNKSSEIDLVDGSFSAFYSQAVSVLSKDISITLNSGITVTKGDSSPDDLALPGTTIIKSGFNIPATHTMSLNNTRLTMKPTTPLTIAGDYHYEVLNIEIESTKKIVNLSDDRLVTSYYDRTKAFDINDVKLDNDNYTTLGNIITAKNTAGVSSSAIDSRRSVSLYFPDSINTLKSFTMRQASYIDNNSARTGVRTFTIVRNGQVNPSASATLSLANNENVITEDFPKHVDYGTALSDEQNLYRVSASLYLSDNKPGSTNSVSYSYAYETKDNVVKTGTITLPVQ